MAGASESGHRLSKAAFAAWCERCQWPLYTFLRGLTGDDEQARDLTQETFLRAWRAAQAGTPPFGARDDLAGDKAGDESGMRRWLFHVGYTCAVSALRRRRLIQWHPLTAHQEVPSVSAGNAPFEDALAESQALREALAALAPADAAVVLLIVVEGLTAAETAQIVGGSAQAVAKRFARAKQRLRAVYVARNAPIEEGSHQ